MANFLEQQVEAAILSAVQSALADVAMPEGCALETVGFWQPAATGETKAEGRTAVVVKILPRVNQSYGSRIVTLPGEIRVTVSPEVSADGALLSELAGPVLNLLNGWNIDSESFASAAAVSGVFRPDGFIFTTGGDADFDVTLGVWYARVNFDIKGHLLTA